LHDNKIIEGLVEAISGRTVGENKEKNMERFDAEQTLRKFTIGVGKGGKGPLVRAILEPPNTGRAGQNAGGKERPRLRENQTYLEVDKKNKAPEPRLAG